MFRNSGKTHDEPIMWGGPGSAYSGKARAYLNKKRVEYQEIFPGQQRYKNEIIPAIGHFVIPVMELEDGTLIQDSTDIILHFEESHLNNPLIPETPVLKALDWLLGYFGSESFLIPGMHYRWNYMGEQRNFMEATFGHFMSDARDTDLQRAEIAPFMEYFGSFLPDLGVRPETLATIEESLESYLKLLNAHFLQHPYFLGGRPGLADFGAMTMLYAHISRDPHPSGLMKRISPHVFRWTERMNNRNIVDAEFPDVAPDYPQDDMPPETLIPVLEYLFTDCAPESIATIGAFKAWLDKNPDLPPGTPIQEDPNAPPRAHPHLGEIEFDQRGTTFRRQGFASAVYHYQRMRDVIDSMPAGARQKFGDLISSVGGDAFLSAKPARRIRMEYYKYFLV